VVDADRICVSSVAVAVKLLTPVVHVIWPTVNERPSATTMKSGMMTILLAWEAVRTPPTWCTTVDEIWSTVYRGYAQGSKLLTDRCASYELDGDARQHTRFLSRFSHPEGVIPTSRVRLYCCVY
jgi:hypothetical protein